MTSRSFGPVADQMKAALERYSKEELIDLMTHIVKTYVVEGTLPLKPEVGARAGAEQLTSLSFPQLILHLQMQLDHREWAAFSVSGEDVWVASGGQRINLTNRPTSLPPAPPPAAEPQASPPPTAPPAGSRGARPSTPTPSDDQPAAPPSPPARNRPGEPEPFSEDVQASERGGMLEID
jgi:hypothetical protein